MPPTPRKPAASVTGSQSQLFSTSREPGARAAAEGRWITAYTDGGSRGNPGPAGYGVLLQGEDGTMVAELSEFLGIHSNNVAEYSALLGALEYALAHGHSHLRIISDSELMVKQIRGQYSVKSPDLRPLYEEARRRISKLQGFEIQHVLRGKNKKADQLANDAMDRGMKGGTRRTPAAGAQTPATGSANAITSPSAPASRPEPSATDAAKTAQGPNRDPIRGPIRGIVRHGAIQLPEDALPEGTVVIVMTEEALRGRG